MSPITVGLLAHNGSVGRALLASLYQAQTKGDLKVVVLHRPNSDTSKVPSDVEKRVVELGEGKVDAVRDATKDLEVVISAVGAEGFESQLYLVQALAGSPSLKAFFPSDFGPDWNAEERAAPIFSFVHTKDAVVNKAKELKVPVVEVKIGLIDLFFFAYKVLGTDLQANKVQYFRKSLENKIPLTSFGYLGHAIVQLITSPISLSKIADTKLNIYNLAPTGNQIASAFQKVNGVAPEKVGLKEEEYEEQLRSLPAAIGAAVFRRWGEGDLGDNPRTEVKGWREENVDDVVRAWAEKA
ncbi:hypothetical protein B9479_008042 [Cryptococcus floricola]|uniref:NmrA-like domain-containing protein n=1 Tax=Cryptococcus floricola TaxID=2591691 RepID=A0A5D3AKR9_9TREE|nr:hypothetical protein B9479_008042 [Cryptococcus floricola]